MRTLPVRIIPLPHPSTVTRAHTCCAQSKRPQDQELEDEANRYFKRLYSGSLSLEEFVAVLHSLQLPGASDRERAVLSVM
eukprot:193458-Chlamydomonas_euryale.AAC.1